MLIAITVAGLLLAQAAAASATPAAPAAQAAATPEKPKKPKMICTSETTTDSIIPKRVCRTPEQVEADKQAEGRRNDAARNLINNCQGTGC